ncbi:Uncharacterised protein [Mycoplasmopsis arginini]|nr:Uncharacterised protein [Chlamydia abortus]SGA17281.1 Uncharacterised protein [Mycoplasmopsis arginini]SGA21265.1 Uncharacterised protein [Mycoplasmopsis arginini]SGA32833.1 Uncharacterised protein [Chlamydia abortus]
MLYKRLINEKAKSPIIEIKGNKKIPTTSCFQLVKIVKVTLFVNFPKYIVIKTNRAPNIKPIKPPSHDFLGLILGAIPLLIIFLPNNDPPI